MTSHDSWTSEPKELMYVSSSVHFRRSFLWRATHASWVRPGTCPLIEAVLPPTFLAANRLRIRSSSAVHGPCFHCVGVGAVARSGDWTWEMISGVRIQQDQEGHVGEALSPPCLESRVVPCWGQRSPRTRCPGCRIQLHTAGWKMLLHRSRSSD